MIDVILLYEHGNGFLKNVTSLGCNVNTKRF